MTLESGSTNMRSRLSTPCIVLAIAGVAVLVLSPVYLSYLLSSIGTPISPPPSDSTNPPTAPRVVTFDFDTGSPMLIEGQNTPLIQTSGGVTAVFKSPSDSANPAFSVQSYERTFIVLSQFSGKWLFDNKPSRDFLDIAFNKQLTSINLTFATREGRGDPTTQPTEIKLTAYMNSVDTTPVGLATARGVFSTGLYPQGTLTFTSETTPFNVVRIEILYVPKGATDFFIDNIKVTPGS